MAYSELDICNLAISKLGAAQIAALTGSDKVSVLCNSMYAPARDFALRSHPWNCAVGKADLGSANVAPVECYFDDAVYNQGTYALRVIVKTAATAYNFLRHSYADDLDISALDSIKIDLRSTFVGTTAVYFKFHSKLSGDWTSNTETISVEDAWETKTFDISSIAQNLREDVDRVEIRFENKASDYIVYIDNMYATSGVSGDETELDYMEYSTNENAQDEYVSDFSLLLFGWDYMFDLPDGTEAYEYCLRVLQVNEDRNKFRVEGRKLLTDAETVQIEYIERISDPTKFDSMLYNQIATKLAADLAVAITGFRTRADAMLTAYNFFLKAAKLVDAGENTPKKLKGEGSWLTSRRQTRY